MFGFKMKNKNAVITNLFEAKAEAAFNVLHANNVFGDIDGTILEVARSEFMSAVTEHALKNDSQSLLELGYPHARLVITADVFAGQAQFIRVLAYDQPFNGGNLNEKLTREIISAFNEFAAW